MEESSTPEILPTGEGVLIIDEVKVYVHVCVYPCVIKGLSSQIWQLQNPVVQVYLQCVLVYISNSGVLFSSVVHLLLTYIFG